MTDDAGLRIAVVGAGVSGLVAAWLLSRRHRVTLFEAEDRIGGHTHTHRVEDPAGPIDVDTGFIVFNHENYPLFSRLLDRLGIDSQPTAMSFSVSDARSGIEWAGSPSLDSVFGQRRNLASPAFWGMLRDILRFGREAPAVLDDPDDTRSVADFARERGYGQAFVEHYLLPLGASLWSCPDRRFAGFPIRFVVEFLHHHRMLGLGGRPQWRSIPGGSRRYVDALLADFPGRVHAATPVHAITRSSENVRVTSAAGDETFDEIVLACHADQALALLGDDATQLERELLAAFPYQTNTAILHTDTRVLPREPRCRAAWNHRVGADSGHVSISYDMNILQRLPARETWCVTLNNDGGIDPARIHARMRYAHPLYTPQRGAAQARHAEVTRANRTSYCGAWWGYGFHEDGVRSAVAVAAAFGVDGP
jgi:predicted NAD/FAD-binding protein